MTKTRKEFLKRLERVRVIIDAYDDGQLDGATGVNCNPDYPGEMSEGADELTIAYCFGWVVGKAETERAKNEANSG